MRTLPVAARRYHVAQFSHSVAVWDGLSQEEFYRLAWGAQDGAVPRELLPFVLSIPVVGHDQVKVLPFACFVQLGASTAQGPERDSLPIHGDAVLMREVQAEGVWKRNRFMGVMPVYHAAIVAGRSFADAHAFKHFDDQAGEGIKDRLNGIFLELQFPSRLGQPAAAHACRITLGQRLPLDWLDCELTKSAATGVVQTRVGALQKGVAE